MFTLIVLGFKIWLAAWTLILSFHVLNFLATIAIAGGKSVMQFLLSPFTRC